MADAERTATLLVSFAIFVLGGGLVVAAILLFLSGAGLLGLLALVFGVVALAGGLFFNLSPIVASSYRPEDADLLEPADDADGEDAGSDAGSPARGRSPARPPGPPSVYDDEDAD